MGFFINPRVIEQQKDFQFVKLSICTVVCSLEEIEHWLCVRFIYDEYTINAIYSLRMWMDIVMAPKQYKIHDKLYLLYMKREFETCMDYSENEFDVVAFGVPLNLIGQTKHVKCLYSANSPLLRDFMHFD